MCEIKSSNPKFGFWRKGVTTAASDHWQGPWRSRGQGQGHSGTGTLVRQCAGNAGNNAKEGVPSSHRICCCRLRALDLFRVRAVSVAALLLESGTANFTGVLQVGARSSPACITQHMVELSCAVRWHSCGLPADELSACAQLWSSPYRPPAPPASSSCQLTIFATIATHSNPLTMKAAGGWVFTVLSVQRTGLRGGACKVARRKACRMVGCTSHDWASHGRASQSRVSQGLLGVQSWASQGWPRQGRPRQGWAERCLWQSVRPST